MHAMLYACGSFSKYSYAIHVRCIIVVCVHKVAATSTLYSSPLARPSDAWFITVSVSIFLFYMLMKDD